MINIADVAAKLDAEEKLVLRYRVSGESTIGGSEYDIRESVLLDVSEEAGLFYVKEEGAVVWVKFEEAVCVDSAEN